VVTGAAVADPGPGGAIDNNLDDVEPNDSPAMATPLGTAAGLSIYTWVNGDSSGGTDAADYFVFRSGPTAGEFTLGSSGLCFGPPLQTLRATLWKVAGGAGQYAA